MSDKARFAKYSDGSVIVKMKSGAEIRFPVAENPRLACGTPAQLHHIELSPFGLHWPDLDEDLSFHGFSKGTTGSFRKRVNRRYFEAALRPILKGLRHSAQGCEARATLGYG